MKKLLIIILSLFICVTNISFVPVRAEDSQGINQSNKKPTSATYYHVNYYNNKKEENPVQLTLSYDKKGRILDDGICYHFYDGKGREIGMSYSGNPYMDYGLYHSWPNYGTHTEINYTLNSAESPTQIKSGSTERRFTYDAGGNLTKQEIYQNSVLAYTLTYTYSSDRLTRVDSNAADSSAYWQKATWYYDYNDGKLSVITGQVYVKGSSDPYVNGQTTFIYYSDGKLSNVYRGWGSDIQFSGNEHYVYDDNGNLAYLDNYMPGEGDDGYKVYYSYGGKPVIPTDDTIKVIKVTPIIDTPVVNMQSNITVYFNKKLDSYDLSKGKITLCDQQTGEPVHTFDKAFIRVYNGSLTLMVSTYGIQHNFQSGKTYYLKIDEGVLKFQGTDKSIALGSNPENPEWKLKLIESYNQIIKGDFHFSSTENFTEEFREGTDHFIYKPDYFRQSATVYNPELAVLSMQMAIASYNYRDISKGYLYIEEFLKGLKFEDIDHNSDYESVPKDNTTGVCIGHKQLDENTTLIALAVRSGRYGDEWAGNFDVGNATDHKGFATGRNNAFSFLKEYLEKYDIEGNVKFWIAGYSRGSAIANLTAAYLDDANVPSSNITYSIPDDVFAYCFEVPASTRNSSAGSSRYRNIFNILNPYDLVVRLPLAKWGYTRYGKALYIPHQYCGSYYNDYINDVKSTFKTLYGTAKNDFPDTKYINNLNKVMNKLYKAVPNLDRYNMFIDDAFRALARKGMGKGEMNPNEYPYLVLALSYLMMEIADKGILEKIPWLNALDTPLSLDIFDLIKWIGIGTTIGNLTENNNLLFPHYAELTLAWVKTLNGTGVLEMSTENCTTADYSNFAKLFVKVNCPVDVEVYDTDNQKVISTKGDSVNTNRDIINGYIDETGAKVFEIPVQNDFEFTIIPTDNGTMIINVYAEDPLTGELIHAANYENIELVKGESYTLNLEAGYTGDDFIADLYDHEEEYIAPDTEASGSDITTHNIEITVQGFGTASGLGDILDSTYQQVHAEPYTNNEFLGWYDNADNLLSQDADYTVLVNDDIKLVAKFSENDPTVEPKKTMKWDVIAGIIVGAIISVALIILAIKLIIKALNKKKPAKKTAAKKVNKTVKRR